ncbi:MAG: T9SS type A sorting domain-containing protein [Bacteroidales bacterium]|nr:T9SS type A sorting domain-containing protein [Bacteroidales bacterium]
MDEVYHSLLLTDVTNDGATVHWYSAEEGTTYNVRLTSADGSVDSVVITTDSSYTFHSLPYNKRYKIQVRKQCHYATYNYDTTVYSPWTTNTSTSTFTLGVDTTSSGIDTTGGGGGGGGIDTTSTGIVMVGNNVFTLNPNPVHGVVEVTLTQPLATNATLTLYDLGGREVRRQFLPAGSQHASFDTEGCPTGTYILKLLTPQGVASRRLVVN